MQMTNEDIVRSYNEAANKSKQIKILADLNLVSPGEIRMVLAGAGVNGVKMPSKIVPRKPEAQASCHASELDKSFFQRLETILAALPEGLSDEAIEHTRNLLQALFADYLDRRLGKGERHGA